MIAYFISSGEMTIDTTVVGRGYSGRSKGINDARMMFVRGMGPIPIGCWDICIPETHAHLGPLTFGLLPRKGTRTEGRSGFYIHGDNVKQDHTASSGCIVLDAKTRARIASAMPADPILYVFP